MSNKELIEPIIKQYYDSFILKLDNRNEENNDRDILMNLYDISPDLKRENRQYWGRELGMLWQLIVTELAKTHCADFQPALFIGRDEICDLRIGKDAIDTKYRVGSGDSGTLKKLKDYGRILKEKGYNPVLLFVRNDNLPSAITAANTGGWEIYTDKNSFSYLDNKIGVNIIDLLSSFSNKYYIADFVREAAIKYRKNQNQRYG